MNSDYSISLANRDTFVQGIEDIKQSWHIILSTVPGSIPMDPLFGSTLYTFIDKPINTVFSDIANTIIKDLELWEKRTKITRVQRIINGSNIILKIYGIYTPTNDLVTSIISVIEKTGGTGGIGYMVIGSTFILN